MSSLRDLILAKHLAEGATKGGQPNGWMLPCVGPGGSGDGSGVPNIGNAVWGRWARTIAPIGAGKGDTYIGAGQPYQHPYFHLIFDTADSTGSGIVGDLTVTEPAASPGFWDGYINDARTAVSFPETPTAWLGNTDVILIGPLNNAGQTATVVVTYSDADGVAPSATVTYTVNDDGTVSSVTSGTAPTNYAISVECTAADSNVGPIRVILTVELDDEASNQNNLNAKVNPTDTGGAQIARVEMGGFYICDLNDSAVINTRGISAYSGTDDMAVMVDFIPGPCCNDRENWAPYFNGTGRSLRGWHDGTVVRYDTQWIAVEEQYAFGAAGTGGARSNQGYRWTEFIPIDVKWAMEVYFWPDPDIAYDISGDGQYFLGGYRNGGNTFRHCWWMIKVTSDGVKLHRREFNRTSGNGQAPDLEWDICLGRWNQLIVQYEPSSTTPGSADGNFRYWVNGKPFALGGLANHGGENPPTQPYHCLMWGYDPINYWSSGSSPAYPFWGGIWSPSWHMDSDIDDDYAAATWARVCGRCRESVSILEAP